MATTPKPLKWKKTVPPEMMPVLELLESSGGVLPQSFLDAPDEPAQDERLQASTQAWEAASEMIFTKCTPSSSKRKLGVVLGLGGPDYAGSRSSTVSIPIVAPGTSASASAAAAAAASSAPAATTIKAPSSTTHSSTTATSTTTTSTSTTGGSRKDLAHRKRLSSDAAHTVSHVLPTHARTSDPHL